MAKKRKVSDIARQRGTSVDDVLAHLKKAGIEVVDGEVSVDEEAIEKAYAGATPAPRRRGGQGGRRRRVIIDAGAARRGGPQGGGGG
ncbi:MAG: translation initiation factor IF-2 N-terminal domain-containing protein, partial [Thermoleophilia bacterium]|nr:translation initiation factor IF-2 N-terminal domain-containing protein [Thermoleophilia bacterium]